VGGCDPPESNAAVPFGGDAERVFENILEVRKGSQDGFAETPHLLATPSGWVQHTEVVPLDVRGQH
jgi:hypothetical protein